MKWANKNNCCVPEWKFQQCGCSIVSFIAFFLNLWWCIMVNSWFITVHILQISPLNWVQSLRDTLWKVFTFTTWVWQTGRKDRKWMYSARDRAGCLQSRPALPKMRPVGQFYSRPLGWRIMRYYSSDWHDANLLRCEGLCPKTHIFRHKRVQSGACASPAAMLVILRY